MDEGPRGLQFIVSQTAGYDWATNTHTHTHTHTAAYSFPGGSMLKNPQCFQEKWWNNLGGQNNDMGIRVFQTIILNVYMHIYTMHICIWISAY